MADELEWQQIVELPTFRKHKSTEKSYLDRIFCNFNTREGVKHTETNKTRHDVLEFDAIIQTKVTEKKKSSIQKLNTKAVDFTEVRQTILDANLLEKVKNKDFGILTITTEVIKALIKNGAKLENIAVQREEKEDPEIKKLLKKNKRLKQKIAGKARGHEREALINERAKIIDQISEAKEQKTEKYERKMIENAKHNSGNLFKYLKSFKNNDNAIGPIKGGDGKIIYDEKTKREAFADYYQKLQAIPNPNHIIENWDDFIKDAEKTQPKKSQKQKCER